MLWFAVEAPVAGVASADELASFTTPEISLSVSLFHFVFDTLEEWFVVRFSGNAEPLCE